VYYGKKESDPTSVLFFCKCPFKSYTTKKTQKKKRKKEEVTLH
jgi:hypothetical protein